MRSTFRTAVAALGILGLSGGEAPQQAAPMKLAFIDSGVILKDAPGADEARKMLEGEMVPLRAIVARWSDSLNALKKAYADGEATMSPAVRAAKQKEMDDKADSYQKRSDSLQNVAQQRQRDVMQPVLDMVNKVLSDFRNQEGYAVIFDIGSGYPIVAAYDRNLDVTDRVLSVVKKQPAPALPGPTAKPGVPPTGPAGIKKPPPGGRP
jgi:outer membrane protein